MNLTLEKAFDYKALLFLREVFTKKTRKDYGKDFKWRTDVLKKVQSQIAKERGLDITIRSLRMTLTEPVTNNTTIPKTKTQKSRVDLICNLVNQIDFKTFCKTYNRKIDMLILRERTIISYSNKSKQASNNTEYYIEKENDKTIHTSSKKINSRIKHAVYYYATDTKDIYTGIATYFLNTKNVEIKTYIKTYSENEEVKDIELLFYGHYDTPTKDYITLNVKHTEETSYFISAVICTTEKQFTYSLCQGTYIARSMVHKGVYAGVILVEFVDDLKTAMNKAATKTPSAVNKFLKGRLLEANHRVFYSYKELNTL